MSNPLGNILHSEKFLFYSKIIASFIAGCSAVFFITKNQIDYYRNQNVDLQTRYQLGEKVDQKKCEDEKTLLKVTIENSMLEQYQKFDKHSKESKLFLETIDLLNNKATK